MFCARRADETVPPFHLLLDLTPPSEFWDGQRLMNQTERTNERTNGCPLIEPSSHGSYDINYLPCMCVCVCLHVCLLNGLDGLSSCPSDGRGGWADRIHFYW